MIKITDINDQPYGPAVDPEMDRLNSDNGISGGQIAMWAGAACGAALVAGVIISLVIRFRHRSGPGRAVGQKKQKQLAEDSDVRYLHGEDDVQLDLTEATPANLFTNFEQL